MFKKMIKKIYLLLFTQHFFIICLSQNNDYDSLKKYSYYIEGVSYVDNYLQTYERSEGSGFFIKFKSDTYYITAKHVLDGCNDYLVKEPYAPNRMSIRLHDENGKLNNERIFIYTETVKDTSVCRLIELYPDIITYKIHNSNHYKIYTIENFSSFELPKIKGDIIIFGFPMIANHEIIGNEQIYVEKPASELLIKNYEFYELHEFVTNLEISFSNRNIVNIDSSNYAINTNDIFIDERIKGFSGAPCFIKDLSTGNWLLLGIEVGINPSFNNLYIIKSQFILDELRKYQ